MELCENKAVFQTSDVRLFMPIKFKQCGTNLELGVMSESRQVWHR